MSSVVWFRLNTPSARYLVKNEDGTFSLYDKPPEEGGADTGEKIEFVLKSDDNNAAIPYQPTNLK